MSGIGGILRDSNGKWLTGFSSCGGITTNMTAELLAILHGLRVAWNSGFKRVICETDL